MRPSNRDDATLADHLVKREPDVIGIFARCNPRPLVALGIDVLAVVVVDSHVLFHMEVIPAFGLIGLVVCTIGITNKGEEQ